MTLISSDGIFDRRAPRTGLGWKLVGGGLLCQVLAAVMTWLFSSVFMLLVLVGAICVFAGCYFLAGTLFWGHVVLFFGGIVLSGGVASGADEYVEDRAVRTTAACQITEVNKDVYMTSGLKGSSGTRRTRYLHKASCPDRTRTVSSRTLRAVGTKPQVIYDPRGSVLPYFADEPRRPQWTFALVALGIGGTVYLLIPLAAWLWGRRTVKDQQAALASPPRAPVPPPGSPYQPWS